MTETLPALLTFYGVVRNVLEFLGALAIVIGASLTVASLIRSRLSAGRVRVTESRFQLSRFLTLALEFQLSSDVLGTAIAPSWDAIGKLAAIGAIRTALNYFLTAEMKEERGRLGAPEAVAASSPERRDATTSAE